MKTCAQFAAACLAVFILTAGADAEDLKPPSAAPWFTESFEGTPPKGWGKFWGAWGANVTTDEAGTPPDGG